MRKSVELALRGVPRSLCLGGWRSGADAREFKVGVLSSVLKADIAKNTLRLKSVKIVAVIKFAKKNGGKTVAAFWRINLFRAKFADESMPIFRNFTSNLRILSYLFRPPAQILAVLGGSCRIRRKPRPRARSSSRLALAASQLPVTFARCQPCLNLPAA